MKKVFIQIIILSLMLNSLFCEKSIEPTVCTDEFVMIQICVVNEKGIHAHSLNILVYNKQNKTVYDLSDVNSPDNFINQYGIYTIYHDGFQKPYNGVIERIVIEGKKDNFTFKIECEVSNDKCHVYKISGPDTIALR